MEEPREEQSATTNKPSNNESFRRNEDGSQWSITDFQAQRSSPVARGMVRMMREINAYNDAGLLVAVGVVAVLLGVVVYVHFTEIPGETPSETSSK